MKGIYSWLIICAAVIGGCSALSAPVHHGQANPNRKTTVTGSPVLNGRGEVVGIAFDSNYEGVIGDYYHDPELNRTICVDIRYVLFLMEEYSRAARLLEEMGF